VNFVNLVGEGDMTEDLLFDQAAAVQSISSALWATIIPWAWSLSNDEHHPFIL
jgi:hypothetical protein